MPALGGRKPSELMGAMLETCPRGEEKTNLFACIFLQRLPREIRVLLAKADQKDPKTLATQANDTSTGSGGAAVPPAGRPAAAAEAEAARRLPGCPSRRLPRRPGWPSGSASSTGDMERPPLPASSPATGRETAVPETPPHRQLNRPLFSGRHRRLIQHLPSSLIRSWFWSSSQES